MTLDQFIEKLGRTKRRWTLCGSNIRVFSGPNYYCPLTGVLKAETGHTLNVGDYKAAAEALGLSEFAREIVWAADNSLGADKKLRKRLLKACGL